LDILETKADVAGQVGRAVAALDQIVPGYRVRTLALPLGVFPADESWARQGVYEGTAYKNELVLLATGGGTVPPNHKEWDPFNVTRIQATNEELDFEAAYVGFYDLNPDKRYVSDGNPDLLVFPEKGAETFLPDPELVDMPLPDAVAEAYRAIRLR
jgi:hypothetical protein